MAGPRVEVDAEVIAEEVCKLEADTKERFPAEWRLIHAMRAEYPYLVEGSLAAAQLLEKRLIYELFEERSRHNLAQAVAEGIIHLPRGTYTRLTRLYKSTTAAQLDPPLVFGWNAAEEFVEMGPVVKASENGQPNEAPDMLLRVGKFPMQMVSREIKISLTNRLVSVTVTPDRYLVMAAARTPEFDPRRDLRYMLRSAREAFIKPRSPQ